MDLVRALTAVLFFVSMSVQATELVNGVLSDRVPATFKVWGVTGSTLEQACASAAGNQAVGCQSTQLVAGSPPGCKVTCQSGYTTSQPIVFTCPPGAMSVGYSSPQYGCWVPHVESNCPPAGTVEGDSGNAYEASSINPTICIGTGSQGCVWKPGGTVPAVCANGKCYQWGPFTATGASCDPSSTVPGAPQSAASAPPEATNCVAKGQCPGSVNGTSVCVPCTSKSQESVTSSASAASSAASGASSPTTSGESGTTTTKTECTGSECTTTTTTSTQKSDGSSEQKSSTKTEPMTDFCAANPKAAVCKGDDESQWGGACAGGFTCKGDAVQCAQAQAGYDLSCAAKTDPNNPTVMAGNAAINAGDRPPGHPALEPEMFDVQGSLDVTNPFGSSCPSDIQISVIGTSVAIPLSGACDVLRVLGFVAVAFSLLGAGRLVVGAL